MRCIIIDDEPLALEVIQSYCEDIGNIEVLGAFTNPIEAITAMQSTPPDLVFSDIEMPQLNGIDFIKALEKPPLIIFTTAYPQYALDGFELNAVDYLIKPIPFPRFVKAVNRAREIIQLKKTTKAPVNLASAFGQTIVPDKKFIFVKSEYENVKIELEKIKFVQGLKDYLKIHVNTNKPILTLMSFKELQNQLPPQNFYRVHRSFIVNINKIGSIQRSKIVIDDIRIPIGESYRSEVFRKLGI